MVYTEEKLKKLWKVDELKFIAKFRRPKDPETSEFKGNYGFFVQLKDYSKTASIRYPEGVETQSKNGQVSVYFSSPVQAKINDDELYQVTLKIVESLIDIKNPLGLSISGIDRLDQIEIKSHFKELSKQKNNRVKRKIESTNNREISSKKSFVLQLLGDYESSKGVARETLVDLTKRLPAETNKKPETFIFELIQNADDYPDPNRSEVNINFTITSNHLVLTHNGLPFKKNNVKAICKGGDGNKVFDKNKIGYKGIGFKSIFKFSDHVWINSGGFSFKFDKKFVDHKYSSPMPWHVMPIWKNPDESKLDEETVKLLKEPVSIFIRPKASSNIEIKKKLNEIERIFESVFAKDERVLLFLRNVRSIDLKSFRHVNSIKIDPKKWAISNLEEFSIPEVVSNEISELIKNNDARVPAKYEQIKKTKITFAISRNEQDVQKTDKSKIFAYLPTDVNIGFSFIINGDFIPDGSRSDICEDIKWNLYLFKESGKAFLLWIKDLLENFSSDSVFQIFPSLNSLIFNENKESWKLFLKKFKEGFDEGISTISFLKTQNNDLKMLGLLCFDETKVSSILGSNELQLLFGSESNLLHHSIAKNQVIRKLFKEYSPQNIFHWQELKDKIGIISSWIGVIENNISFLNLLSASKETELFAKSKIALNKKGQLSTPDSLWINVPNNLIDSIPELGELCLNDEVYEKLIKAEDLPFKIYNSNEFFNQVISNDELLSKLNDFAFSIKFFDVLAAYHEDFSSELIDKIKALPFYEINRNQVTSIGESNFYFPNRILVGLVESLCFPDNHISLLASDYLNSEEEQPLWLNLGCKEFKNETAADFIKSEVCDKIDVINSHLIDLFNRDAGSYFTATSALMEFYFSNKNRYSEVDGKEISSELGKLLICNSENELKALNESFIPSHYSGKDSIESLLNNFPSVQLSFISKEFSNYGNLSNESLAKIFKELGANIDETSFIRESLIPSIHQLNPENIVAATRLLFQHQDILNSSLIKADNFPALTKDGILVEINQVNYGSDFLEDGEVKSIISRVALENELSSDYLKDGEELSRWLNFFFKRGLKVQKEEDLIAIAIEEFKGANKELDEVLHFEVFSSLLKLFSDDKLSKNHLAELKNFKLKCINSSNGSVVWKIAKEVLLSSKYKPIIHIENYELSSEVFFLSDVYLDCFSSFETLKEFILAIGVLDGFEYSITAKKYRREIDSFYPDFIDEDYPEIAKGYKSNGENHFVRNYVDFPLIRLIKNGELNKLFWEKVNLDDSFRKALFTKNHYVTGTGTFSVYNEPTWFIKTENTVPNLQGQLCKPFQLYDKGLKDLIEDDSKVSDIDFSQLDSGSIKISDLIGVKTELDLKAVLNVLRKEKSHNCLKENEIFKILNQLLSKELSESDKEELETFKGLGKLLNQKLEWVELRNLYYLDSGFRLGSYKSKNLLHKDFERLAEVLGLKKLKKSDFELDCIGQTLDSGFKGVLKNRIKFLAFLMDNNNWEALSGEILNEANRLKFYSCKNVALSYPLNRNISNNDYEFLPFEDKDEYFYLGKWDGFRTAELFPALENRLNLKAPVNTKVLKDILIFSEQEVVEYLEGKGHIVPEEWKPKVANPQEELITKEVELEEREEDSEPLTPDVETKNEAKQAESSLGEEYNKVHEEKITGEGDLTEEEQIEAHEDNMIEGLNYLEQKGYKVNGAENEYGIVRNIISPEGNSVNVIIKSAAGGLLHIAKYFWEELENTDCFILVKFPGGKYQILKTRSEIIENELNVNLLFRVSNENDVNQVDQIFDSLIDSKSQLLVVTDKKMLVTLSAQFEQQKTNPITESANISKFDY